MLLSKIHYHQRFGCIWEFQSLFFWMLLSKYTPTAIWFTPLLLFQSLFFWMLLSKLGLMEDIFYLHNAEVSILIFLDASL